MILGALSALWTSFAPQMANHLWQSTLFVVLAAILAFALRKNQGRVRYWVWLTASLKFLLPFSLLIALGSHLAKPRASTPAQAVVYSAVEDFSQPFAGPELPLIPQAPAPASRLHLLPPIIVAVWLVGITVVLLVWAAGWIRVSRMVRRAKPLREGPEVDALRRREASFGVRKPIRLVLSRNWMEPGIFGVFRPVLIWPEGISQHLDARHIDAILAHEICHARRHDNLTAILHMLVEAVFWFHPLVWWVGTRLEAERERACDEEVSLLCNQPHVYAESILRVCKFCSESPLACVSGITGADLKNRIVQIMTERVARKLDLRRKLLLLAAAAVVVAAPLELGMLHAADGQVLYTDGPLPSFEVATIRPMPNGYLPIPTPHGGSIVRLRFTPKTMIGYAYNLPDFSEGRILNSAGWTEDNYEVEGKISDSDYAAMQKMTPEEKNQQIQLMVQSLLKDRMKLRVHLEKREETVYALEVAKGGMKLAPAKEGVPQRFGVTHRGQNYQLTANGGNLEGLALLLGRQPEIGGRSVVNRTGITGSYDVTLHWTRTRSAAAATDDASAQDESGPSFFTAIQEQLRLRLATTKGEVDYVVVDHIEKPTVDGAEVPDASIKPVAMIQPNPVAESSRAQLQPQNTAAPSPRYEYEAATIKPSQGPGPYKKVGLWAAPDGFNAWFITPQQIISIAYGVESFQFSGGPSWLSSDRFDIQAKMDAATADALKKLSPDQRMLAQQQMLQALLADRFQLTVHRETKEGTIYRLVIAKGGPKLQEAKPRGPGMGDVGSKFSGDLTAQTVPIAQLAKILTQMLGHPVLDKTELKGVYDFKLQFTPDDRLQSTSPLAPNARVPEPPADSNAPSLFDALQEQLGLKLESGKGPVEVIVIDHVERPSAN